MMSKGLLFFFCFFIAICSQGQETKMLDAEIVKLQKALSSASSFKTLVADFTQYKKVGYVKKELISKGKFYVKNPDKLAWIYTSPEQYSMVFKEKKVFINDQGKRKSMDVGRSKHFERISQAIRSQVSHGNQNDQDFSTSYFQNTKSYIMKLDPISKSAQKSIKQIVIYFDKSVHQVAEIKLFDSSGGYTHFVLTNRKVNGQIDDDVFVN